MTDLMPTLDRRDMLGVTLAAAAASAMPAAAKTMARAAPLPITAFGRLLGQFAEEILRLSPSTATSLGLDTGARLVLKSQLGDASPAGSAKWAAQVSSMLTRLGAVKRDTLSQADQIRYDTVKYAAEQGATGTNSFMAVRRVDFSAAHGLIQ